MLGHTTQNKTTMLGSLGVGGGSIGTRAYLRSVLRRSSRKDGQRCRRDTRLVVAIVVGLKVCEAGFDRLDL